MPETLPGPEDESEEDPGSPLGTDAGAGATAERRAPLKGVLARLKPARSISVPKEIEEIVRIVKAAHPKADTRAIVSAFDLARAAHRGQLRKSGEAFIEHPIGVARILADQGMDATSIIAAFLHDAVEDTDLGLEEVRGAFGDEVASIIDGLTKIEKIRFRSAEQEQAENLRKMIVAMARDLRVLIIKLADRLHNMQTIGGLDPSKRHLMATETLEIYAPLAHRLGMQQVRSELEDLAFETLYRKRYKEIQMMVAQRQPEREEYLEKVVGTVNEKLREVRVKAEVTGRHKHYYSIYEKMISRERELDEIFDLVGVRVITDNVRDCWAALGAVHSLWKPVPGRFKDYIANPKFNVYQSLHTTVVGREGKPLEIQIRTGEMHQIAEWGVASHWHYKEGFGKASEEHAAWMNRMLDLEQTEDDSEFLQSLRIDLFSDEVFVFTPKGDVVELLKGATPIDFAYAIHTEVGHACVGGRVDGRLVPLDYQLSSGQTVEVMTSKSSTGPSRDWLGIVATPRARTKIRQWFTKERREEAIGEGRESLIKAVRRAGLSWDQLHSDGAVEAVADELKFAQPEILYQSIGEGRTSVQTVLTRFARLYEADEDEEEALLVTPKVKTKPPTTQGVTVRGIDDVWVRLARCCMPVPNDPIIGFVTRGRGVSIHRQDCPNAADLTGERARLIEVAWDPNALGAFPVLVQVEALDRPKLLRDVTTAISDYGVNIISASATAADGIANLKFTFEVTDPPQLAKILATIRKVEAVFDAYRLTPVRR